MKVLCVLPENPRRGLDSHQGQVLLADGETGQLRALLDASAVTADPDGGGIGAGDTAARAGGRSRPRYRRNGRASP